MVRSANPNHNLRSRSKLNPIGRAQDTFIGAAVYLYFLTVTNFGNFDRLVGIAVP
jgi:hypothetical protein